MNEPGTVEPKESRKYIMYMLERLMSAELLSVTQERDNGRHASWQRHRLSGIGQLTVPSRYIHVQSSVAAHALTQACRYLLVLPVNGQGVVACRQPCANLDGKSTEMHVVQSGSKGRFGLLFAGTTSWLQSCRGTTNTGIDGLAVRTIPGSTDGSLIPTQSLIRHY